MSPWENLLQNPQPRCHLVQLYDSSTTPARNVSRYLHEGLKQGESALVIATPEHWNLFGAELDRLGIDVDFRIRGGQLQLLDAADTLREIMSHEEPDWECFERVIRQAARRLRRSENGGGFRAYGEMVAILWKARRFTAAVRLEQFWNKLLAQVSFRLFCSYSIDVFGKNFHPDTLDPLLRAHTHLVPAQVDGKLDAAFRLALDETFGKDSHILRLLVRAGRRSSWAVIPDAESMILWIRKNLPDGGDEVVERARLHYRRMLPDSKPIPLILRAAGQSSSPALRST
jgi:hypothetical protein